MKSFILMSVALVVAGCSSYVAPSGCPGNDLDCNGYCYDPNHYACESGKIVLTSCDTGYQICPNSHGDNVCVRFPSDCCPAGGYCYGELCSSNNSCRPIATEDCGNGKFCPVGHVCTNNGNNCSL